MSSSSLRVLVADDEPSMLELVVRHLRRFESPSFTVLQASDGDEAWRLAQEHKPDLVVLDVMMPGMSGWEICRKIRHDDQLAHTGVVMLTGIGENLNQMTSPLYGADAYIDKPFDFEDFDDRVRETLEARKAERERASRPMVNGTTGAAKPAVGARAGKRGGASKSKQTAAPARGKAAKAGAKPSAKKAAAKTVATKKKAAAAKAPAKTSTKKAAPKLAAKAASTKKTSPARGKAAKAGVKASAKKAVATKAPARKTAKKAAAPKRSAAKKPAKATKKTAAKKRAR